MALIGALSFIATGAVSPDHAGAEIYTCNAPKQSYFDGAYTSSNTVIGSSADILNHFGGVCDTDTTTGPAGNVSTAWTMLAGAIGGCQYAQAGFLRWYGSTNDVFFAQDNSCTGQVDTTLGVAFPYGQTHQYWVQWIGSCNCLRENVDVTTFQTTPFDPKTAWTEPFSNQWLGEVKYKASDMPGNPVDGYTHYTYMQVQQANNSEWTNTLPAIEYADDNAARWTYDNVAYNQNTLNTYDIWTYYEYSP